MKKKLISFIICFALIATMVLPLVACADKGGEDGGDNGGGDNGGTTTTTRPDALVLMSEELDGLFNPFFSTTAPDATIVSMTQIGMITSGYANGDVTIAYGDNEAVVVKDLKQEFDGTNTTYTFVLKNGIRFSDGHPLTMEDVLFNLYVYLDPVYFGSNTMKSTDIVGLKNYSTQTITSGDDDTDAALNNSALALARSRIDELVNCFKETAQTQTEGTYDTTYDEMVSAIEGWSISSDYKNAISNNTDSVTSANLKADYDRTLEEFRKELTRDYASAKDAYSEEPFKSRNEFQSDVTKFMHYEGYVDVKYAKDEFNKDIKSQIDTVTLQYNTEVVTDMESAINYVYNDKVNSELHMILQYWATGTTLLNDYIAQAKEVILHANVGTGDLVVPNISGIKSLGHNTDVQSVTIGNNTYNVAHNHNSDGTPSDNNTYDVLEITINGVDPKAIWNFAFAVAPQHYYGEGSSVGVDIANNKFGVEWGTNEFMNDIVQSPRNVKVPVGAGAYKATDRNNNDNPDRNEFYRNNVVYFKANNNFLLGTPNIEKVRYQVISATNAIGALDYGTIHFASPQFTQFNIDQLNGMKSKGIETTYTDQLGYGYIGINAGKIPNINIRKAIMCAMNTKLALQFYSPGMAENIYWPMSTVSWAFPKTETGDNLRDNGHDYPALVYDEETAKQQILDYMAAAGVSAGDSALKIDFTIAGANVADHPTYRVFDNARVLLNKLGWEITVRSDTQALSKLSTGSLAVWAAAWGSTVDPDLYQVYHKNSSATSVIAWGYREILNQSALYPIENGILEDLSEVIDDARETEDRATRTALYEEAMGYILDLAVELPVYQRKVLYAYNANVIDKNSLPQEINPYSSPLDKIWEIKFAQ